MRYLNVLNRPEHGFLRPKIAALLSVMETCKRLQIKLRKYVNHVLPKLPSLPVNSSPSYGFGETQVAGTNLAIFCPVRGPFPMSGAPRDFAVAKASPDRPSAGA